MKRYIQRESDEALRIQETRWAQTSLKKYYTKKCPKSLVETALKHLVSQSSRVVVLNFTGPETCLHVSLLHSRGVGIALYILKVGCNEHRQLRTTAQKDDCSSLFQKRQRIDQFKIHSTLKEMSLPLSSSIEGGLMKVASGTFHFFGTIGTIFTALTLMCFSVTESYSQRSSFSATPFVSLS